MKRPASQYYWGDWRRDLALQSCSLAARGLWHEMNCLMHEGTPYGHLAINGNAISVGQLARLVGIADRECKALLAELEAAAIYSMSAEGLIYSRRMVRDEQLRQARAAGGVAGGEHGHKGGSHGNKGGRPRKTEGGLKTPLPVSEIPPPSSSSSSSSLRSEDLPPPSGTPPEPSDPPAPPPEPRASRSAETAQGTRLPENWEPDDGGWKFAVQQLGSPAAVSTTLDSFRDWWKSKPGKDGRKSDWPATWRNWIREEVRRENRNRGSAGSATQPGKLSVVDRIRRDCEAQQARLEALAEDGRAVRAQVDEPDGDGPIGTVVEGAFRTVG